MREKTDSIDYFIKNFSDERTCNQVARETLERRYFSLVEPTSRFNRQLVSYHMNKTDVLHSWFKFKEGFSSLLVEHFIEDFRLQSRSTIMDPFMGSGTTALVAQEKGINSVGFDILLPSKLAFDVKINAANYNISELGRLLEDIKNLKFPDSTKLQNNHLSVTEGAYPENTDVHIAFLTNWVSQSKYSKATKELSKFLIMSLLEELSYTRKDGQYLRWDYRSSKIIEGNKRRIADSKPQFKTTLDKGDLPGLKTRFIKLLKKAMEDIKIRKEELKDIHKNKHQLILGSVLFELPIYAPNTVDCVITSPPYCNRYDYTRTYALELAYLGISQKQFVDTRQRLLTCTVENKSKIDELEQFYTSIGAQTRFDEIKDVVKENDALNEILVALRCRNERGEINNKGVIRMVEGYFTELAFVFRELHRVCKTGAHVVFVNDNVRYAGEIIPVDFISTELAESFGFRPEKVYVLPQTKGNSSQQMKKFGQVRLRKSITVWKKP